MGDKRPYLREGEREWLLTRLSQKPELTLHALLAELGERGLVRHALAVPQARGPSFKKNGDGEQRRIARRSV